MKVKQYKSDQVIFVEDKVSIILDGIVFTRNHHKSAGMKPKIYAKHMPGDVLGCGEIDHRTTTHTDSWNVTLN